MDKKITIVGCGPGSEEYLTAAAVSAVQRAKVILGAQRLLDLFPGSEARRVALGTRIEGLSRSLEDAVEDGPVAVLVSGDPGVFSLAKLVVRRFGRDACRVIPGISSVQAAFAAIGLDWADARIISAHKEDPDATLWHGSAPGDKIAVLAGRSAAVEWIADLVESMPRDRRVFVCEDLSLSGQRISEAAPEDIRSLEVSSRTVFLIIREGLLT